MLKDQIELFFYWINERHAIFLRRQAEEDWPWTNDQILQTYKFCNVFRELDTVTVWIDENIRKPYANHPELFFNLMMSRLINLPGTLEEIGFIEKYNADYVRAVLQSRKDRRLPMVTGAYMITGTLGGKGVMKPEQLADYVLQPVWNMRREITPILKDNLKSAYYRILNAKAPGFGRFLCYEVVTDLRWTRYLSKADDIYGWANAGPGALRGINRLYGNDLRTHTSQDFANEVMQYLLEISSDYLQDYVPELEMRDIEHSLCEYDKYSRVLLGQGRPRSKFIQPNLRS